MRVSTWSFLSIVHPLRIPIPMYKKKVRVQQENSQKITYCLHVLPTKFLHYVPYTRGALMGWRNFSKTAEKSSSSPRAAGVLVFIQRYSWLHDLSIYCSPGTQKNMCRMYQVRTQTHSRHGLLPPTTNHKQENHGRSQWILLPRYLNHFLAKYHV